MRAFPLALIALALPAGQPSAAAATSGEHALATTATATTAALDEEQRNAVEEAKAASAQRAIVITGHRLADLRARLAECIARGCPPNEEIDAAMALAEGLFEGGDLAEARRTVAASLDRNRRHAQTHPEPVADLFRARARVARHLGRDDEAMRSTYDVLRTLRNGIPGEDHRHLTARFEVIEMIQNQSDNPVEESLRSARRELLDLAEAAGRAGRPDVAALAELRAVWLGYLLAPGGPAYRQLKELAANEADATRATGAKILLARIHHDRGDRKRSDALIAEVAARFVKRRNLVFNPGYELDAGGKTLSGINGMAAFDDQSVDVGFWVDAAGRVHDLTVVRGSGDHDFWARGLLRAIRGRIYSPSPDGQATYRLERYTYTSALGKMTGSRLQARVGHARLEYYDLSDAGAAEAPAGGSISR